MPQAVGTNPAVLRWARERAGHSLAEVAAAFDREISVVEDWETGRQAPSLAQLEKLAYQLYKRPLAVFFFPAPPAEEEPEREFRTLPETELESLAPDTRFALREALARQMSFRELAGGQNLSARKIFRDISASPDESPRALAKRIRDYLGVSVDEQAGWEGSETAFKHWRDAVENCGIFVFKRPFKQVGIDAFCLPDLEFPVIFINNKAHFTRQQFSLFHEVAHLLFATAGITKDDDSYIYGLSGTPRKIEIAANRVAHELLVPESDFAIRLPALVDDESIGELARRYHVSREVILRRLLDKGIVDAAGYEKRVARWRAEARPRTGTGGNYYFNQGVYLSRTYAELAFSRYHAGRLSIEELAEHLRMKARNLENLEAHLFGSRG
jgi:Zn-dependent peptidase ImmA (M78 family)